MNFLNARQVAARMTVSRTMIYDLMRKHGFPKPVKFGGRSAWREDEVEAWMQSRSEARSNG